MHHRNLLDGTWKWVMGYKAAFTRWNMKMGEGSQSCMTIRYTNNKYRKSGECDENPLFATQKANNRVIGQQITASSCDSCNIAVTSGSPFYSLCCVVSYHITFTLNPIVNRLWRGWPCWWQRRKTHRKTHSNTTNKVQKDCTRWNVRCIYMQNSHGILFDM